MDQLKNLKVEKAGFEKRIPLAKSSTGVHLVIATLHTGIKAFSNPESSQFKGRAGKGKVDEINADQTKPRLNSKFHLLVKDPLRYFCGNHE